MIKLEKIIDKNQELKYLEDLNFITKSINGNREYLKLKELEYWEDLDFIEKAIDNLEEVFNYQVIFVDDLYDYEINFRRRIYRINGIDIIFIYTENTGLIAFGKDKTNTNLDSIEKILLELIPLVEKQIQNF